LNIHAVCQSPARIHHSARAASLLQRLRDFLRAFAHVIEFLRGIRDELSAAGVEEITIIQHVSKPKFPATPTWDGRRQFAVLNKPHNRWSTEAQEVRGLLCADLLLAGEDTDRSPLAEFLGSGLQDGEELLGQLDPLVNVSTGQVEPRLRSRSIPIDVRIDEVDDASETLSTFRTGGDDVGAVSMRVGMGVCCVHVWHFLSLGGCHTNTRYERSERGLASRSVRRASHAVPTPSNE